MKKAKIILTVDHRHGKIPCYRIEGIKTNKKVLIALNHCNKAIALETRIETVRNYVQSNGYTVTGIETMPDNTLRERLGA